MPAGKMTDTFWYRHGVKLVMLALMSLCYMVWGISLNLDDNISIRDSKIGFLEHRCDKQADEIMRMKRRIDHLDEFIRRQHGDPPKEAWE